MQYQHLWLRLGLILAALSLTACQNIQLAPSPLPIKLNEPQPVITPSQSQGSNQLPQKNRPAKTKPPQVRGRVFLLEDWF
ncbi:hypothetical protein [Moraxella cuniculi]|uniref:hypothetical protein n=1 Tax=Moraxella cuniculi TaxID=34061 RepID=UPI0009709434|nr:hypothetical protein [Moraxella cuniculi]OOS06365.1 hypothetical protein B0189_05640 [Moraxella cuniculi]